MANYTGAVCRLCRREGVKLFLKGSRCSGEKCAVDRRSYRPGMHGKRRVKLSDFGHQLREKQKAKTIYGVLEKQFRTYFKKAERSRDVTGEILLQFLERRLDNVVFRCRFAPSRPQARQMVSHGFLNVDGKKVNRPSFLVSVGDKIEIRGTEEQRKFIVEQIEDLKERGVPDWLKIDEKLLTANVEKLPKKEDVGFPIQEQLIVELYSK